MIYRRLDVDGDMVMGQGPEGFLTDLQAMDQTVATRLKALRGEWWEEDESELPVVTEILGLPQTEENRAMIELMIVDRITGAEGVIGVEDVQSEYRPGRIFHFSCVVNTLYGRTTAEVDL